MACVGGVVVAKTILAIHQLEKDGVPSAFH
jgi:hypothetical protein